MAVGPITSPATWLLGTVLAPSWAQSVQDCINNPGSVTFASIVIDGSGNAAASSANAGAGHVVITGPGTPTIAAQSGAGTSPTVSIVGNDVRGVINITTGTSTSAGAVALVTFRNAYPSSPVVIMTPTVLNSAILASNAAVYAANAQAATFVVTTGSTALAASTTYQWSYVVIG